MEFSAFTMRFFFLKLFFHLIWLSDSVFLFQEYLYFCPRMQWCVHLNILELCNLLRNKNIFKDYNYLIEQLNHIFGGICFKCGREKTGTELQRVDIEGFSPIKFGHFICEECIQNETSNQIECIICKIQHKYLLKDF